MSREHEQLKSMLKRAGVPFIETLPNLTDDLVGVRFSIANGSAVEFYFNLSGDLLNIEILKGPQQAIHPTTCEKGARC